MPGYGKKEEQWRFSWAAVPKCLLVALIFMSLLSFFLGYLAIKSGQGFLGSFAENARHLTGFSLNVAVLLLVCTPAAYFIRFTYRRSQKVARIGAIITLIFVSGILCGFYAFGIENFAIFSAMGAFAVGAFNSLQTLWPFAIALPFIFIFYKRVVGPPAKFTLENLSIRNHTILIDDGRRKNFKALVILRITNIPKNAPIKEERTRKRALEKLAIPGDLQYLHYHLTSLAKILPHLTFEIRIKKHDIQLRVILSATGDDVNQVLTNSETLAQNTITAFHFLEKTSIIFYARIHVVDQE